MTPRAAEAPPTAPTAPAPTAPDPLEPAAPMESLPDVPGPCPKWVHVLPLRLVLSGTLVGSSFLYLWISSVYSVITQVYQPNVNPRSGLVTIGEAGDFSNSASSSSQKQSPHGETRNKMPSPANDGTRASNASDNWDEQGASRCAAWPHGCNLTQTIKRKGEVRAQEYVFLYACSQHCRTCAYFLLREVGVSIDCKSTGKDGRMWASKGKGSQEQVDFIEFWDTYVKWQK